MEILCRGIRSVSLASIQWTWNSNVRRKRKTLELIQITLRMLRELHCKLPVEVWHLPGELTSRARIDITRIRSYSTRFWG